MSFTASDATRTALSQSLPLVRQRKPLMVECLAAALRDPAAGERHEQAELTAIVLFEMLIRQVIATVEGRSFTPPPTMRDEHRALNIGRRHYSRFGDALVPVLKDVLGPNLPPAIPAAWGDAFWAAIRAGTERPEPGPSVVGRPPLVHAAQTSRARLAARSI